MRASSLCALIVAGLMVAALGTAVVSAQGTAVHAQVDRTELPIKGPWYPPITTLDARDATAPPVFEVTAPKDAPNVVVIETSDGTFYRFNPQSLNHEPRSSKGKK